MNEREPSGGQFVKAIILGDDGIHIDLSDGLRLSGPLAVLAPSPAAPARSKRRMLVSGHEAVYASRNAARA